MRDFIWTPDENFAALDDFSYPARCHHWQDLRMHYLDVGPSRWSGRAHAARNAGLELLVPQRHPQAPSMARLYVKKNSSNMQKPDSIN